MPQKFIPIVASLLLVVCLHSQRGLAASAEVDGFAGMVWGSSLQANQQAKNLILSRGNDGKGGTLYTLKDVSMDFGQATLAAIECSFVENRLHGVMLLFSGEENFLGVKAEAIKRYGKPIFIPQQGSSMLSWPNTKTSIVLSYTLASQSGFLYLKAKKLPPVASITPSSPPEDKQHAVQKPTAPSEDLALLDQASGVEQNHASLPKTPVQTGNEPPLTPDVNSEVQGYIDRDQALTRVCWESVGQVADQVCREVQQNLERLHELGWCRKPGSDSDGLQVSWIRCGNGEIMEKTTDQGKQSAADVPTAGNLAPSLCSLVIELFATAADLREKGETPMAVEKALLQRQEGRKVPLRIEQIRETVELVYFDQRYAALPLLPLTAVVEEQCRSGRGPYIAPLQR